MKRNNFIALILLSLLVSCQPSATPTAMPQPAKPSTPTIPFGSVQLGGGEKNPETIQRPLPKDYCWNTTGVMQGPKEPPAPFLYQPFEGQLTADTWTSQMDHDQPSYQYNGVVATLGELLRYDTHRPGLAGGTEVYPGGQRFSYDVSYTTAIEQGYYILAYQSPSFESYVYYDGHDGQDFAVSGRALAAADGKVVFKGDYGNSLGRVVEIYHPQGYLTRYAHLASFEDRLEIGTQIKTGQPVGNIGGSAVVDGKLKDNHWGIHLHFSVFRWNKEKSAWQITDPFGWDPWAGPDLQRRQQKQQEDPLIRCDGEVSYDLWVGEWPRPLGVVSTAAPFRPTHDRYIGGWLGQQPGTTITQPPPSVKLGKIQYSASEASWIVNEDGSGKTMLKLPNFSSVILGCANVKRLMSSDMADDPPGRSRGVGFIADGAAGKAKLIYYDWQWESLVNSPGRIIELGSGLDINGYDQCDAMLSQSGKVVLVLLAGQKQGTLYIAKTDGSGTRTLPNYVDGITCTDDRNVVLTRFPDPGTSYNLTVEMQNVDGSNRRELASASGAQYYLFSTPDCNKVWVAADEGAQGGGLSLYMVDSSGTKRRILNNVTSPKMAPDYKHILFSKQLDDGGEALYVANSDGGQQVELGRTYIGGGAPIGGGRTIRVGGNITPRFSNDGSRLIFSTIDERVGRESLLTANSDGSSKRELLNVPFRQPQPNTNPEEALTDPDLSQRGQWIVAGNKQSDGEHWYLFRSDGQRFDLSTGASGFIFSPLEKYLAFSVGSRHYIGSLTAQKWQQFFDKATAGGNVVIYAGEVRFSTDEKKFVFGLVKGGECKGGVYVGDSDTGKITKVADDGCTGKWISP